MNQSICPISGKVCPLIKYNKITNIENGKAETIELCNVCADKYLNPGEPTTDIMQTTLNFIENLFNKEEKKCPNCNSTLRENLQNRMGCPQCYDNFNLTENIKKVQDGAIQHTGKSPKNQNKLKTLENKLNKAIKIENYEEAAKIKKLIEEHKKNSPNESGSFE